MEPLDLSQVDEVIHSDLNLLGDWGWRQGVRDHIVSGPASAVHIEVPVSEAEVDYSSVPVHFLLTHFKSLSNMTNVCSLLK